MLAILRTLDASSYTHRTYVVSEGDGFSAGKARDFEASLAMSRRANDQHSVETPLPQANSGYDIRVVPRARRIHQPLSTTPLSAIRCLAACFHILRSPTHLTKTVTPWYPDLVLTNGPGTAVCVVLACMLLRYFDAPGTQGKMRTIYIESWARVKSLSLSGKILLRCVDRFLVQWESLSGVGGRGEFLGVLV